MTREEVTALMASCTTAAEWKAATVKVKTACGRPGFPEYPDYWYEDIIKSGLCDRVTASFYDGLGSGFAITTFDREGRGTTRIAGGPRDGEVIGGDTPEGSTG